MGTMVLRKIGRQCQIYFDWAVGLFKVFDGSIKLIAQSLGSPPGKGHSSALFEDTPETFSWIRRIGVIHYLCEPYAQIVNSPGNMYRVRIHFKNAVWRFYPRELYRCRTRTTFVPH